MLTENHHFATQFVNDLGLIVRLAVFQNVLDNVVAVLIMNKMLRALKQLIHDRLHLVRRAVLKDSLNHATSVRMHRQRQNLLKNQDGSRPRNTTTPPTQILKFELKSKRSARTWKIKLPWKSLKPASSCKPLYGLHDEAGFLTCPLKASVMKPRCLASIHSMHFCTTWLPFWSFTHFRMLPFSSLTISTYKDTKSHT